jgi:uncharacterized protein YndB with AHSA1/START domain
VENFFVPTAGFYGIGYCACLSADRSLPCALVFSWQHVNVYKLYLFPKTTVMKPQPFTIERTYNAPVEKVWRALTDKAQMKEWYFNIAEFKPEVGFRFQFTGEGPEGEKYLHLCKILEVAPNKKLSHTWSYEGQPEETVVTWELFEDGQNTRVKLTHEGLEKIAHHGPAFAANNFAEGWKYITGTSLKEFLEK